MVGVSNDLERQNEYAVHGFGLSVRELESAARHQFAGSLVVGVLLSAFALIGLHSMHDHEPRYTTARKGVQQPVFVASSEHIVAAAKRKIETP